MTAPQSVQEAAKRLADLRQQKADLAMLESELVTYLARHLPPGGGEVEGVGFLEVKRGAERKRWDGQRLLSVLIARGADEYGFDKETGEVVPIAVLAQRLAEDLAECAGLDRESHGWRATQLKKRRLDPDQFCTKEGSKVSVIIRGAE